MILQKKHSEQLFEDGFTIIPDVFTDEEIEQIICIIDNTDASKTTFRKTNDLFAIRQFLKEIPGSINHIFSTRFNRIINDFLGQSFFAVKSIYFDKPPDSNWFVSYHQDLTISVKNKVEVVGFGPWSVKQNQYAVQPPLSLLESNFTIRIHLDNTTEQNGALRIIPGSHKGGIHNRESIDKLNEVICEVRKGGIMIMKPLLLHSSRRTANDERRRVIHIEFSNQNLPLPLEWAELIETRIQVT